MEYSTLTKTCLDLTRVVWNNSILLIRSQKDYVDNINDKECNAITCNMPHDFPTSDITIDISSRVEREDCVKSSTSPRPFSRHSIDVLLNLLMIECDELLEYNDRNAQSIFE